MLVALDLPDLHRNRWGIHLSKNLQDYLLKFSVLSNFRLATVFFALTSWCHVSQEIWHDVIKAFKFEWKMPHDGLVITAAACARVREWDLAKRKITTTKNSSIKLAENALKRKSLPFSCVETLVAGSSQRCKKRRKKRR